jgi:hypothetical protein
MQPSTAAIVTLAWLCAAAATAQSAAARDRFSFGAPNPSQTNRGPGPHYRATPAPAFKPGFDNGSPYGHSYPGAPYSGPSKARAAHKAPDLDPAPNHTYRRQDPSVFVPRDYYSNKPSPRPKGYVTF